LYPERYEGELNMKKLKKDIKMVGNIYMCPDGTYLKIIIFGGRNNL